MKNLIFILLIIVLLCSCEPRIWEFELVQLSNFSSFSGSFFLGCGSIDGDLYYIGYYKKDGYIVPFKKWYAQCRFIEDDKRVLEIHSHSNWVFHIPQKSILYNIDLNNGKNK
jgi:hypothetical protein